MSIESFDFTYNLNSENSQNEILDNINKGREKLSIINSCFFTDTYELSQGVNEGFGPIDSDKFRVTSRFTTTNKRKAYAVTEGHLFIVPNISDSTKVNLILKPLNSLYIGVKIKFLVYRGINKNSFYETSAGNIDKIIDKDDIEATSLITRLWDDFNEFNSDTPNEIFNANYIGIDSSIPNDTKLIKNYYKKGEYNLPYVKQDEHIGFFQGTFGFEVIIDHGDYTQQKSDTGFELDIDFLKATECIFNIESDNPSDIAGNRPIDGINMVSEKIFRENIYGFIDPAAFYGAHISSLDITRNKNNSSKITCYNNDVKGNEPYYLPSQVYNNVVSKFTTKNKIYLYVQSYRGRSLDFINDFNPTNEHGNEVDFLKNNSWPIKIFNSNSLNLILDRSNYWKSVNNEINTPENTLFYNIKFALKIPLFSEARLYVKDCFNRKILTQNLNTIQVDVTVKKPAYIDNITGGIQNIDTDPDIKTISNIIFVYQDVKTQSTYRNNDLFGPINIEKIFEPNDFENSEQVIETVAYKKPKFNFNNDNTLNEMLVIYDEGNIDINEHTRLYIVHPIDSNDKNFVKGKELVTNYTIDNDLNKLLSNNYIRLGDGLRFWKNQKTINGDSITYLTITGFGDDYKNIENSYMIGITKNQFESLMNSNSDVKYNVFFHFQDIDFINGFFKAKLGIHYEDNMGLLHTQFPATDIYVYSSDRKIFTTNEFANNFKYYSEFAKTTLDFLPNNNWKSVLDGIGDYGIDWMRSQPLNLPTNIYPPFRNITGLMNGQTDPNQYEGSGISFQQNPEMYNRLKNEIYGAISIPWGTSPNDEYFTTWLRLNKTEEVELKLKINVNTAPQELKIKYEGNFYEIKVFNGITQVGSARILQNNINEYIIPNTLLVSGSIIENLTLKIKRVNLTNNNSANEVNRKIEVFASELINGQIKENIAGMLKLYQEPEVTLNVQFVKVKYLHPTETDPRINSDSVLDRQKNYLIKYLKQAGIQVKIKDGQYPEINVTNDPNFQIGGHYIVNIGSTYYIRGYYELNDPNNSSNLPVGYLPIKKYLKGLLTTPVNENTMIVYFVNGHAKKQNIDTGTILPTGILSFLGGFSNGDDSDTINFIREEIISNPSDDDFETISHEVLHSLGIGHTFDNAQRFVFDAKKTDNIMDYTHLDHPNAKVKPSIYYWQWLVARQNTKSWKRKSTEG